MSSIEYETPRDFFDTLNKEFHFTLDVAATAANAKIQWFIDKKHDSFKHNWVGNCWMNPPYDKSMNLWIERAYMTAQKGHLVVCLIQGRSTDTKMWHDFVMKASEIRFIKDRLHFGLNGKSARANISSVVVVFRPYCKGPPKVSSIDTKGNFIK